MTTPQLASIPLSASVKNLPKTYMLMARFHLLPPSVPQPPHLYPHSLTPIYLFEIISTNLHRDLYPGSYQSPQEAQISLIIWTLIPIRRTFLF